MKCNICYFFSCCKKGNTDHVRYLQEIYNSHIYNSIILPYAAWSVDLIVLVAELTDYFENNSKIHANNEKLISNVVKSLTTYENLTLSRFKISLHNILVGESRILIADQPQSILLPTVNDIFNKHFQLDTNVYVLIDDKTLLQLNKKTLLFLRNVNAALYFPKNE